MINCNKLGIRIYNAHNFGNPVRNYIYSGDTYKVRKINYNRFGIKLERDENKGI